MYYLKIHLYQEEFANDIMVALTEAGVSDIMVMDAVNASRRLAHNLPIFAGFRGELGKTSLTTKIFDAVIEDKEIVTHVLESLKKADLDFQKEDMGRIVLIPAEVPIATTPVLIEESESEKKLIKKRAKKKTKS